MKHSDSVTALQQLILTKEAELELEGRLLKICLHTTYEKLKPINLIKSSIKEAIASPNLKSNIVNTVLGLATGFIAKKLVVGKTHNPLSKIAGMLIEVGVANKVTANADDIKSVAHLLLNKVINNTRA